MPHASLASQLRVIVLLQELPRDTSPNVLTVVAPQPSEEVGAAKLGVAVQLMVALAPWPPIVGGVRSTVHVAVLEILEVFPQASDAVKVLV